MRKTGTVLAALALLGVLASCASQAAAPTPAPAPAPTAEGGGSYGLWATDMLHTALVDDDLRQSTQDYLDQVDALLERFDAARAGLSE